MSVNIALLQLLNREFTLRGLSNATNTVNRNTRGVSRIGGRVALKSSGVPEVSISAPNDAGFTASYSLTLPVNQGASGQVLVHNGSGNLTWSGAGEDSNGGATEHNIYVGTGAGGSLTSGAIENFLMGVNAGSSITTGDTNVAIGNMSLFLGTDLSQNVVIGVAAFPSASNVGNSRNVIVGNDAFTGVNAESSTDGSDNVGIGNNCGLHLYDCTASVLIGAELGNSLYYSDNDIIIGYSATAQTISNSNIVIGKSSRVGPNNTSNNIIIGTESSAGASYNIVIGGQNGSLMTGTDNIIMGSLCTYSLSTGNNNISIGAYGGSMTTGTHNICIGEYAGNTLATGSNNICIGGSTAGGSTNGASAGNGTSNNVCIGARATSNGNNGICIGYLTTCSTFDDAIVLGYNISPLGDSQTCIGVSADVADENGLFMRHRSSVAGNTAGWVVAGSNNELVNTVSSRRYKENIQDYEPDEKLFWNLRPVTYNAKKGYGKSDDDKTTYVGLIAEEVAELYPELAFYKDDGQVESVQYDKMVTLLIKHLQREKQDLLKDVVMLEDMLRKVQTIS